MKILLIIMSFLTIGANSANIWKPSLKISNIDNKNVGVWQGNEVKNFNDYPYMASINFNDGQSLYDSHDGGATFINQNFLLTAGHLVSDREGNIIQPDSIKIAYGGLNLQNESDFNIFKVTAVYRFYDYKKTMPPKIDLKLNDLAIIEIENHPNIKVKTVSLVNKENSKRLTASDTKNLVIGWGFTAAFVTVSNLLRYGNQIIKSEQEINQYLNTLDSSYWNTYNSDKMIGTEAVNKQRITQGDSGGPALVYDDITKQNIEIGIVSWSPDVPDGAYSFYTRLSNPLYLDWINKIINPTKSLTTSEIIGITFGTIIGTSLISSISYFIYYDKKHHVIKKWKEKIGKNKN